MIISFSSCLSIMFEKNMLKLEKMNKFSIDSIELFRLLIHELKTEKNLLDL